MDPITHGIAGALLGKGYFAERKGRVAIFAATLGAVFPDIDIVAEIVDPGALAAPDVRPVRKLGDEQRGFGEDMPRNAKRLMVGKTLDPKVERQFPHALRRHQ